MFSFIRALIQNNELRRRLLFTVGLLFVCRLTSFVPVPGVNGEIALAYFRQATRAGQSLFQLMDIFSGGAFAQMTLGALGVLPYVSASIMLQLAVTLFPGLQRDFKENADYVRPKLARWTRYLTLLLALFQSGVFARYALKINQSYPGILSTKVLSIRFFGCHALFYMLFVATMTCGTLTIMWLGEQISESGVGVGTSLIISAGIVSSFPKMVSTILTYLNLDSSDPGDLGLLSLSLLICIFVLVIIGCIFLTQGERRLDLQYARKEHDRTPGRPRGSFLPLKVNHSGVMPVIFSSSILMLPITLTQILGQDGWGSVLMGYLSPGSLGYTAVYAVLIFFFNYFWTLTQFHADQLASDMKKSGAFIPAIRQGLQTQRFLEKTMCSLTVIGGVSLIVLATFPQLVGALFSVDHSVSYFFGGTSMLILVGVVLDTSRQVSGYLTMQRYEEVLKTPRSRLR
ncbi:preprotein translocase subunit SecY [Candidatus Similichlamydia laticola]|uniref:Protein translocase subunit SecY n=1 Tax=Candidatus Similichlamydia laticola TaxID=2170265 RepID=A0A369KK71_9BACT|nr:preprotein translocase subunit SecY [Candidatus Similichlamydia laticola]RDB31396.1 Preprotein translocase secY subunit [Candidatus Similichlamydia laticola]